MFSEDIANALLLHSPIFGAGKLEAWRNTRKC